MKLILSRKGFDSSAGGVPSPILPDGRMISLPIPDKRSPISYEDIISDGFPIGSLVSQLTRGRIPSHFRAHLDPDLVMSSLPRLDGWRPLFGQTGAAQGHLRKNGIGSDDLFLFFGLFQPVKLADGRFIHARNIRPCHVIWGWLQIEEVLELGASNPKGYEWAEYHPHFNRDSEANNVVYVARRYLTLDGTASQKIAGGGVFPLFSPNLQLTAASAPNPSTWELPAWLYPTEKRTPLTYHADLKRWRMSGTRAELRSAARGQEFILDCAEYPEAIPWVTHLLKTNALTN